MSVKRFLGVIFLLTLPFGLWAQNVHQQIREMERERFHSVDRGLLSKSDEANRSDFDVTHYRIQLDVDPYARTITGKVTTKAVSKISGLNEVTLDLFYNMTVDSVVSNGSSLDYTHSDNEVTIPLARAYGKDESAELTMYYHGRPLTGVGFGSFNFGFHNGKTIISTLSEPFGAPTWWPCKDNPADKADSVDIVVTVPDHLVVASNGTLTLETDNGDGTKTFHWAERYPISTYLVSLAITNYERFTDYYRHSETDSMEVQFYVYPEHLAAAQEDFNVTVPMIECYASLFGEYPFIDEKYGMAEFAWGGAMEHQTCTSYGSALIRGDHYYDWVVAHELAHQWFGDLVTMKRWSHIWLNEGFASYAEALWAENIGGEAAYHRYVKSFDLGFFPTSVFVHDSTNIDMLFSRTVYDKGAYVLHMLRHVMGEASFFNALRNYAQKFAFGNATTEDFRSVCEAEFGHSLDWFFRQWVYGFHRPSYEYRWSDSPADGQHIITLDLDQVQTRTGPFKMPLDIVLETASGNTTIVVWDSLASQRFQFVMNGEVTKLQIDPDGWVLKDVQFIPTSVAESEQPRIFTLHQNYPNPFNAETVIGYDLPREGNVTLDIYNVLGQRVRRLVEQVKPTGSHSVKWDGRDISGEILPSGIYIYRVRLNETMLPARKMLMLK
ncbi:T9SS type A sorting domain-containing protein [candidate division KSB1 bacterium]|nr:T9SS type A sorting domain-containing protein [candidate division KSB1 bacterium]NIR71211.1 T9SS type A sorting domain-containing protein [candidate division KSB1 bacterium]NIS23315.1 T9SS type A sorting domain-containing protein [candidate division KSB1 bacterium]NIT70194.1 T9SS type A sorting domain-containing protein [candidate division KSB1 bacterium]NIU23846.1 T9SS type A sorting domain-containing protein [candidate division KSB1 bacterium]